MIIDYRCSEKGLHLPGDKTLPRWNGKVDSNHGASLYRQARHARAERDSCQLPSSFWPGTSHANDTVQTEAKGLITYSKPISDSWQRPSEQVFQISPAFCNFPSLPSILCAPVNSRHGDRPWIQVLQLCLQSLSQSGCISFITFIYFVWGGGPCHMHGEARGQFLGVISLLPPVGVLGTALRLTRFSADAFTCENHLSLSRCEAIFWGSL